MSVKLAPQYRKHRLADFWSKLEADQEVRWTGSKTATYFVQSTTIVTYNSAVPARFNRMGHWIWLRRHTGKTFLAPLIQIRPHIIVTPWLPFPGLVVEQYERAERRRELHTIRPPAWCRLCGNSGVITVYKGPDNWDIRECPADHRGPSISVYFIWEREPRWFD